MTKVLNGKTALVTGAGRGIGKAIALQLAADGALVAVHYGHAEAAAEAVVAEIVAAGGRAFAIGADLLSISNIASLFNKLDASLIEHTGSRDLDILVNNAGAGAQCSIDQTTEEQFDFVFNINVKSLLFCMQHAMPRLRDGGRVINISSLSSRGAVPGLAAYAASKAAMNSLTISAAAQLGPRGITVNAVAPGMVDTDMTTELQKNEALVSMVIAQTAMRRIGRVDDISGVVAMLAAPASGWVTGQVIEATGGARM